MDWITKRYDQFLLVASTVALLVSAVLILFKAQAFGNQFTSMLMAVPQPQYRSDTENAPPDPVDMAEEKLKSPPVWNPTSSNPFERSERGSLFVSRPVLVANGAIAKLDGALYKDSLTGRDIPNRWLFENGLPLVDPTVTQQDPDKDGFKNEDEWRGQTDPNNKASHPPYYTKLFLDKYFQVPFPYVFAGYGDPKDPATKFTVQLDQIDHHRPTLFLKLSEMVPGTKLRLDKFEFKEAYNPATQDKADVSVLTLLNVDTGKQVVLTMNQVANSPEGYARFVYEWPSPVQMIQVKEGENFMLRPETDEQHRYQLIGVNEDEARILLPSGEIQVIKPDPRRGPAASR